MEKGFRKHIRELKAQERRESVPEVKDTALEDEKRFEEIKGYLLKPTGLTDTEKAEYQAEYYCWLLKRGSIGMAKFMSDIDRLENQGQEIKHFLQEEVGRGVNRFTKRSYPISRLQQIQRRVNPDRFKDQF